MGHSLFQNQGYVMPAPGDNPFHRCLLGEKPLNDMHRILPLLSRIFSPVFSDRAVIADFQDVSRQAFALFGHRMDAQFELRELCLPEDGSLDSFQIAAKK